MKTFNNSTLIEAIKNLNPMDSKKLYLILYPDRLNVSEIYCKKDLKYILNGDSRLAIPFDMRLSFFNTLKDMKLF